jgi:hypothetical protein
MVAVVRKLFHTLACFFVPIASLSLSFVFLFFCVPFRKQVLLHACYITYCFRWDVQGSLRGSSSLASEKTSLRMRSHSWQVFITELSYGCQFYCTFCFFRNNEKQDFRRFLFPWETKKKSLFQRAIIMEAVFMNITDMLDITIYYWYCNDWYCSQLIVMIILMSLMQLNNNNFLFRKIFLEKCMLN